MAAVDPLLAPFDSTEPLSGIEEVKKRTSLCIHWLDCRSNKPQHPFGTDGNVRDLFGRVLYEAQLIW